MDTFSVRWQGEVDAPSTGTYTFYTYSDDGVKLWVNDTLVLSDWKDHQPTEDWATISLTGGQRYNIVLEYYENTGGALVQLKWQYGMYLKQLIPLNRLYPDYTAPGGRPGGEPGPGPAGTAKSGGKANGVLTTTDTLIYLHSDHLGSVSVATGGDVNNQGQVLSSQEYDPWGKVRSGGVTQTKLNYTGQKLDDTGLLFYNARYYDPVMGRFTSPDSIVPSSAGRREPNSSLTVDFHERSVLAANVEENVLVLSSGFWFERDADANRQLDPFGPANPGALNRCGYALGNPVRYNDPAGHWVLDLTYNKKGELTEWELTLSDDEFQSLMQMAWPGGVLGGFDYQGFETWISEVFGDLSDLPDDVRATLWKAIQTLETDFRGIDALLNSTGPGFSRETWPAQVWGAYSYGLYRLASTIRVQNCFLCNSIDKIYLPTKTPSGRNIHHHPGSGAPPAKDVPPMGGVWGPGGLGADAGGGERGGTGGGGGGRDCGGGHACAFTHR